MIRVNLATTPPLGSPVWDDLHAEGYTWGIYHDTGNWWVAHDDTVLTWMGWSGVKPADYCRAWLHAVITTHRASTDGQLTLW